MLTKQANVEAPWPCFFLQVKLAESHFTTNQFPYSAYVTVILKEYFLYTLQGVQLAHILCVTHAFWP